MSNTELLLAKRRQLWDQLCNAHKLTLEERIKIKDEYLKLLKQTSLMSR